MAEPSVQYQSQPPPSPPPPPPPPADWNTMPEIEMIKAMVGKHFPIYEVRVAYGTVSLFCNIDTATLEPKYDELRKEMRAHGYTPVLVYERGEHVIHVVRAPKARPFGVWVNAIFFVATIVTTLVAGAFLYSSYKGWESPWTSQAFMWGALTFTIPLMALLGLHELSHYFAARRHGIAASLPFFIPSFPPLGTFGALISLREPIPSKKAMLDVGCAGPLASFAISVPLVLLGLYLCTADPGIPIVNSGGGEYLGTSLLFSVLMAIVPLPGTAPIHPTAFAGWVGLFVTAINLLPVGQLDGGHVARALFGDRAKWLGYAMLALLLILGFFFFSWLILALFIFFVGGIRHPPPLNDVTPLDTKRKVVGGFMVFILVTCFVAVPMGTMPNDYSFAVYPDRNGAPDYDNTSFQFDLSVRTSQTLPSNVSFDVWVVNAGNVRENVSVGSELGDLAGLGWSVYFTAANNSTNSLNVYQNSSGATLVRVVVVVPPRYVGTGNVTVVFNSWRTDADGGGIGKTVRLTAAIQVIP
ncbi:MAG: site-2 protease family protein [Euryarchaeota archaeon]|nr:site-2 protease family protein [Euryarchaeota archaeon]